MKFNSLLISELIDEIAMGPFGSNIKVDCFVGEGVPVLNGSNLDGFELSEKSFRYVTEEKANSLNKANAHKGDVVITHRGTLGQIVYIPETAKYERYVISQSQFRIKCNDKVMPEYLVFYFHTPIGQHKLLSNASQVGVPALARPSSTFQQIEVEVPDMATQKRIVSIIDAIHKRIKTNKAINDNLSEMLQSIYQQRFNCPGNGEKQGVLADICDYSKDRIAVSSLSVSNYYSTENMLPGKAGAVDASSLPTIAQTTKCKTGDVLISNIRPYFRKIVYCQSDCGCSTDVLCFTPKSSALSAYLFSTLYADRFFDFMVAGSKGTKMPRGDKQQIMTYTVHIPSDTELCEFNELAYPILAQIESNRLENIKLSALRDGLLPKLMSGEVDVSGIDV